MSHSINGHFTPASLLKFAAPSIIMMMFMSLYTIIDGIFISRFVGSNALSSLNIVYPIINIVFAIGTMLGTGGNAIISRYMGEGKDKEAKECMTQFVVISLLISVVILVLTHMNLTSISRILGASDLLLADCDSYLSVVVSFAPAAILQCLFQSYFVTAGRPNLGLVLTMIAGILNAVLDYVFIVVCQMGISGAALATGIGQSIPAIAGLLFFTFSKGSLHFTHFRLHLRELGQACYNGSSEMISQLSNAIVTFLFNIVMMRLAGEQGVAAITILLYGQFLFNAFYLGFSIGIGPIVGFQYGAGNKKSLKHTKTMAYEFAMALALIGGLLIYLLRGKIGLLFGSSAAVNAGVIAVMPIFLVSVPFDAITRVSTAAFYATEKNVLSYILTFAEPVLMLVLMLALPPLLGGQIMIWWSTVFAKMITALISIVLTARYR